VIKSVILVSSDFKEAEIYLRRGPLLLEIGSRANHSLYGRVRLLSPYPQPMLPGAKLVHHPSP